MTTPQAPWPPGEPQRGHEQDEAGDDPEEIAGLARERTSLAWTRTAISFAALGGVVLKANVLTGLIILAVVPVIWHLGRVTRGSVTGTSLSVIGPRRLFIIAVTIAAVALLCLIVAIFGQAVPGALR